MRSVLDRATSGDEDAQLAVDVAVGGSIDALVFTAGVGENSSVLENIPSTVMILNAHPYSTQGV